MIRIHQDPSNRWIVQTCTEKEQTFFTFIKVIRSGSRKKSAGIHRAFDNKMFSGKNVVGTEDSLKDQAGEKPQNIPEE